MNESEEVTVNYVLTLEELSALTREGGKPAETLMNVVALIARRFHTDVCSAYLLEPDRANLVLAATLGLRSECIGTLRMALHEGLAGMVAEQVRPVAVEEVRKHPRFKFFGEAGEEVYHSFLGVPLVDCGVLQGVLVVQTVEPRSFAEEEVRMLCEAAAQVAPVVSEARTLDRFIAPAQERPCGHWRAISGGAGTPMQPVFSESWTRCVGARSRTTPSPCSVRSRWKRWSSAPPNGTFTAVSTTLIAACKSI